LQIHAEWISGERAIADTGRRCAAGGVLAGFDGQDPLSCPQERTHSLRDTDMTSIWAILLGWHEVATQSWAAAAAAPEIDATGAVTGLAVLAGAPAVVAERRRQE